MNNIGHHLLVVTLSLVLANVLHMVVVKRNFLSVLNIPVWTSAFGANKTWRGFVFVPLFNTALLILFNSLFHLQVHNPAGLGLILGGAYILFELPNSFIKRRLGIAPGELATKHKLLFALLDKTDSAFGVTLTYFLLGNIDWKGAILLFSINASLHIVLAWLLVIVKIKKSI